MADNGVEQLNLNNHVKRRRLHLHAHAFREILRLHAGKPKITVTETMMERGYQFSKDCSKTNQVNCSVEAEKKSFNSCPKCGRVDVGVKEGLCLCSTEVSEPVSPSGCLNMDGAMAHDIYEAGSIGNEMGDKGFHHEQSRLPVHGSQKIPREQCCNTASDLKTESPRFDEYWVPVRLSNVQLEQYCSTLIENSKLLCSSVKKEVVDGLHDILISARKCCDHPYLVDRSLEISVNKGRPTDDFLSTGIEVSGKLELLDRLLPLIKKQGLRVLILFQTTGSPGQNSVKIGDILDDFVYNKFGGESYVHLYGKGFARSKKQNQNALDLFNDKDNGRFIILIENSCCHPSIKLSSVDVVILFNSYWDPLDDIRSVQKMTLHTQSGHVKIFRLYSSFTLEEKALLLAKSGSTVDSQIRYVNYSVSHMLLMWGATFSFRKLSDFHCSTTSTSNSVISSDQGFLLNVLHELSTIFSCSDEDSCVNCSVISKIKGGHEGYSRNISPYGELEAALVDDGPPHAFWTNVLPERQLQWKFLPYPLKSIRKRVQLSDNLAHGFVDGKETITAKCRKVYNRANELVCPRPRFGSTKKRGARKACKLAGICEAPVVVYGLKASSVSEVIWDHSSGKGLQSISCSRSVVDHLSCENASLSMTQVASADSPCGVTWSRESHSAKKHDSTTIINYIDKNCRRRMTELNQKQKKEIQEFFRTKREEREKLEEEHRLESSIVSARYGETGAREYELKKLDQNFKEKLDEHSRQMNMLIKNLEAGQLTARTREKLLRAKWLTLLEKNSEGPIMLPASLSLLDSELEEETINLDQSHVHPQIKICDPAPIIECQQHPREIMQGMTDDREHIDGVGVSSNSLPVRTATTSAESHGENDVAVMIQEKALDTCKEQLSHVCHLGPSNEAVPSVSFSEKLSVELQCVPETDDARIEKLNASCIDPVNEPAFSVSSGENQSEDMENSSIKVLEGDGSSNMVPRVVHFNGDPDCRDDGMDLDTAHSEPWQESELSNPTDLAKEQSTVPTCPPRPEIGPTDSSACAAHCQRNVVHDCTCQDRSPFRAVLGTVPTCPPCPEIRPIDASASNLWCPSNAGVNLPQQSSAAMPLVGIEPYMADVSIGNIFPGSTDNYFGQPSSVRPDLAQCTGHDPLQIELERMQKEKEEAIKKHHHMIMQLNSARDKEMEQIQKKYDILLQDAETTLLQKKEGFNSYFQKAAANQFLAKIMRSNVTNAPALLHTALGMPQAPSTAMNHSNQQSAQQPVSTIGRSSPSMPIGSLASAPPMQVSRITELISSDSTRPQHSTMFNPMGVGPQPHASIPHLYSYRPMSPVSTLLSSLHGFSSQQDLLRGPSFLCSSAPWVDGVGGLQF
ncbi:hypothetical protein Ancab_031883 [Ancistrocladus abbreviatus]